MVGPSGPSGPSVTAKWSEFSRQLQVADGQIIGSPQTRKRRASVRTTETERGLVQMRALWVVCVLTWYGIQFASRAVGTVLLGRRSRLPGIEGEVLSHICERLGGAFLKAGQLLSTRVDLFHADLVTALGRLRDEANPVALSRLRGALAPLVGETFNRSSVNIDPSPLASATIAQVHIAMLTETQQQVAIKVRRPGIEGLLNADVRYARLFTLLLGRMPWFRKFPIAEATKEVCTALLGQVDFRKEAKMLERFGMLFRDNPKIKIPEVFASRCTDDLIVMEYLHGYRPIPTFRGEPVLARAAVQTGLRALYKMIFNAGLIHCDLHASNILCNDEGRVALLDFGFVSEMTPKAKQDFSEFFLSIAFRDGKTAARIVRETAIRIVKNLDELAFERDMQVLVESTAGRKAGDFQVAGFVFELFQIQRRHGIYGSPNFTLPILSLLTYEGMIKDIYPDIDFQQEAVPFVLASLATRG